MILIVGATGSLGGAVARKVLADGHKVRVLVRSGSSGADLVAAGAEAVVGDLKDAASLRQACAGVDTLITTANAMGRGGADTTESVDRDGNQHLIDAAAAEGVGHFVFTSALGASTDNPAPFLRAKGEAEHRLMASGMTWTILQPNVFMDTSIPMVVGGPALAGQPITLVGDGRRRHSMVAMRDVAEYVLAAVDTEAARNARIILGGPEPVSWRDIIAAFETELGRPIPVQSVPLSERVPGLPDAVDAMFHALATYDSPIDMTETAATYGVRPTSVADFVRDLVAGADRR